MNRRRDFGGSDLSLASLGLLAVFPEFPPAGVADQHRTTTRDARSVSRMIDVVLLGADSVGAG